MYVYNTKMEYIYVLYKMPIKMNMVFVSNTSQLQSNPIVYTQSVITPISSPQIKNITTSRSMSRFSMNGIFAARGRPRG
jgi:hypothetical protein